MTDAFKAILFKKEVTYGTDAAPTVGANAVPTRDFDREPIVVDQLDRKLDTPSRGRTRTANTNRRTTCSFKLDIAGSGEAGTAAPFMEMLEACGMSAPVLTADTDAVQNFAGALATMSSATIWDWMGEERVRSRGNRGTFGWDFTAGQYGFFTFNFTGLLPAKPAAPVDDTAPTGALDYSRWVEPLEVNTDNTDFTLDGYAAVLQSFTGDINADVKPRNLVGANYVHRGNHAITGTIVAEAPDLDSKDYFLTLDAGDEVEVQLVHGTEDGNIVQLDGAQLQILKITRTNQDDVLMLNISYALNISAGSDDLTITAK